MSELAAYTVWVPTLMLVIFRVAGIFISAPLLSDVPVPARVKAAFSIVVALAVTARIASPVAVPGDWVTLVMGIGGELLIGGIIGYAAGLLFLGVELGAQHIGQQMGIALAQVYNPLAQATANVMSILFHMTALVIFLAIGGHRTMLAGLLDTFHFVPLMGFSMHAGILKMVVALLSAAFVLAVKVSAPVLVALLLTSVSLGVIQRTMPQFNILSAGFQVRILVSLLILAVTVASLAPLLENGWQITTEHVMRIWPSGGP